MVLAKHHDGQKVTMAWDWFSPIPGTLNNSQYRHKQSGTSPNKGIDEDAPRSSGPSLAVRAAAAPVVYLQRPAARVKVKAEASFGIFGRFRHGEIAREFAVRLALL